MSIIIEPSSLLQLKKYNEYLNILNGQIYTPIYKIIFLNEDETEETEVTTDIFDISGTFQNTFNQYGVRRAFNIVIDNTNAEYDINSNNLFIGKKLKLFAGYKFNNQEYLFSQGVFYLTNPNETNTPSYTTLRIEAQDKWYGLSTLYGNLPAIFYLPVVFEHSDETYEIMKYNIYELIISILKLPQRSNIKIIAYMPAIDNINYKADINNYLFNTEENNGRDLTKIRINEAVQNVSNNKIYVCTENKDSDLFDTNWELYNEQIFPLDYQIPLLDPYFQQTENDTNLKLTVPYSISKTRQNNYADIFIEFSKMLPCNFYYDINGRLTNEPTNYDTQDYQKEIIFDFDDLSSQLYSINNTFDIDKIYNDITVVATIQDVGNYSIRVVNNDPRIITNITNIPNKCFTDENLPTYSTLILETELKEKYPEKTDEEIQEMAIIMIENNIKEYAIWLLKQKSTPVESYTINCIPLYHLETNKLITFTYKGEKKICLIKNYNFALNSEGTMSINVERIFDFNFDFNIIEQ